MAYHDGRSHASSANEPSPFVGGAEKARRNARKRMHQPRRNPSNNHKRQNNNQYHNNNYAANITPYPKSMRPYERFFGSLLSSSATDLHQSLSNIDTHRNIIYRACSLLNVPTIQILPYKTSDFHTSLNSSQDDVRSHHLLQRSCSSLTDASLATVNSTNSSYSTTPSSGTYDNARSYYMSKAPLILEESRCIIADALKQSSRHLALKKGNKRDKRSSGTGGSVPSFTLQLTSMVDKHSNFSQLSREVAPLGLNFDIIDQSSGSGEEKGWIKWTRPGNVLLLQKSKKNQTERRPKKQKRQSTADDKSNDEPTDYTNSTTDAFESAVLACIVPTFQGKSEDNNGCNSKNRQTTMTLSLMIFRRTELNLSHFLPADDLDNETDGTNDHNTTKTPPLFQAIGLTTLISQVRQMDACLRMTKVSFMPKLLGQKNSTHIRFDNSDDDDEEDTSGGGAARVVGYVVDENGDKESSEEESDDCGMAGRDTSLGGLLDKLPKLNTTQERAASYFLNSMDASLVLVQGPPGTGKSTFLVNVICRRLANDPNARLLVAAPTNKAVTVLAQRFLDVATSGDDLSHHCNAVLVGVEDKLMPTSKGDAEYLSPDVLSSSLRSIYVYTWTEALKKECLGIASSLQNYEDEGNADGTTIDELIERATKVKVKLSMSIPNASSGCKYDAKMMVQQLEAVAAAKLWEKSMPNSDNDDADDDDDESSTDFDRSTSSSLIGNSIFHINNLIDCLEEIDCNDVVPEMLATARIIFCTLSTAGASILKQTRRVDDLLIDEAAAATECEICIPFHLRPKRLLAVGDPSQLPPTIVSRHAADLGLSMSMHARLMNECSSEYIMLVSQR